MNIIELKGIGKIYNPNRSNAVKALDGVATHDPNVAAKISRTVHIVDGKISD